MTECLPRWETPRTSGRRTYGPQVATLAGMVGMKLMPWQRRVLDVALEFDDVSGRFFYREVRLTVPRQSGKTVLLLMLMVFRCVAMGGDRRVAFTMQDGQMAKKKMFNDFLPLLSGSQLRPMFVVRRSNGDESFTWSNGSMWFPLSNSETAGHGLTLDLGVIDEAFDNDGRSEQAMVPAMMTKKDAQTWIVSTAGTTDDKWFNSKMESGRAAVDAGKREGVAYFEWSADPAADAGDPETWRSCMPALGHTVDLDTIRSIYESMPLAEFQRAFLNIPTDRAASAPWKVIAAADWSACESRDREIAWESPIVLGVDTSLDRMSTTLTVAGFDELGKPQVELADGRGGTAWVVDRIVGMSQRHDRFVGVAVDVGSPAATFIDKLEARGVKVVHVSGPSHALFAQAFMDAVRNRDLTHRGQDSLTAAVAGAAQRKLGDRWLWNRRDPSVDITPLVSATLAYGVLTLEPAAVALKPKFAY